MSFTLYCIKTKTYGCILVGYTCINSFSDLHLLLFSATMSSRSFLAFETLFMESTVN